LVPEVNVQFFGCLNYFFTVDAGGKGFFLEFLFDSRYINIGQFLEGLTKATATIKPVSSSQANKALSILVSRAMPVWTA
jgi:hypothetical protein